MDIKWINEGGGTNASDAFISLNSYRAAGGAVEQYIYFSRRAIDALGLVTGERMLVGLDEESQVVALKPTLFGGNRLIHRRGRTATSLKVVLPIFNLPAPQLIQPEDVRTQGDLLVMPFRFDAAQFRGWKRQPSLSAVA